MKGYQIFTSTSNTVVTPRRDVSGWDLIGSGLRPSAKNKMLHLAFFKVWRLCRIFLYLEVLKITDWRHYLQDFAWSEVIASTVLLTSYNLTTTIWGQQDGKDTFLNAFTFPLGAKFIIHVMMTSGLCFASHATAQAQRCFSDRTRKR